MEDIFKTENRLMIRLIRLHTVLPRKTIREILHFFDTVLSSYSLNDVSDRNRVTTRAKVIDMDKDEYVKKLLEANELVKKYKLFPGDVFTDPNDTEKAIYEYDYYFMPRTRTQYAREEAEAKAGINGKYPMEE